MNLPASMECANPLRVRAWRLSRIAIAVSVLLGLVVPVWAQRVPALGVLPDMVAQSHPDLVERRAKLMQERGILHGDIDRLHARCGAVEEGSAEEAPCRSDQAALRSALDSHILQSDDFNRAAQAAMQNPIAPNLAKDPNAARLSAASLQLVDARMATLRRAIALLGDSNPEWARERGHVREDMREDTIGASMEGVNLLSLGLAEYAKSTAEAHVVAERINAEWQAFQEPLASLPSEEARLDRVLATTQDPELTKAILAFKATLQRLREAKNTKDVVNMTALARDSVDALNSEFEIMKLNPPHSHDVADGLYASSAIVGSVAIVFVAEGPAAGAALAGSVASSIAVGGRELVNLWQENGELAALDRNGSDRNRMKIELTRRLDVLQQQHDQLAWAVQHAESGNNP